MRKTVQQLEEDYAEANRFREQRRRLEIETTPDRVDRLERAIYGSTYTNPEITATIGLADAPIDAQQIHEHTRLRALQVGGASSNRENLVVPRNRGLRPTVEEKPEWTLVDLLQMPNNDYNIPRQRQPSWWEEVDPGARWRNLPIPEITDAKQLLDLQEVQVLKLFLMKSEEDWNNIPGMLPKNAYASVDGKLQRVPGSFVPYEDLGTKFPNLKLLLQQRVESKNVSRSEIALGTLQETAKQAAALTGMAFTTPGRLMSFIVPDKIGVEQEVMGVGLNIPIKSITEPAAQTLRGAVKTAATGFVAAAQATKTTLELMLTNPGYASSLGIQTTPMDPEFYRNYKQGVIDGNIITQVLKRAMNPNQKVDLGGGYFPEGPAMEAARANRDAALPQIDGESFTLGNALIFPLIQEGYIDRNSYAASVMSGTVDALWTIGTDPGLAFNPVKALKGLFNISDVAATAIANSRKAEIIEEAWTAERKAAGLSIDPKYPIIEGRLVGDIPIPETSPRFAGYLPPATKLPDEIDDAIKTVTSTELEKWKGAGNSLAALDSPPDFMFPEIIDEATRIRRLHGVIDLDDGKKIFDPLKIDEMPYTFDGQRTLTKLTEFTNVGEMYDAFLGNMPIGLAYKIQEATELATAAGRTITTKEVHAILREGVLSGDPLYGMREVPGLIKQVFNQTGKQIAYWSSGHTRQFAMMPRTTFFSFEDPMSSINDMKKIMEVMNIPKADRHVMLSDAIKTVVTGDVGKRFELGNKFHKTILTPALEKAGVPKEWIDNVARFEGQTDGSFKWSMDAMGDGYPIMWMDDGSGEVLRSTDLMAKGFMMVNPQHLKQVIRDTTRFWKTYQAMRPMLADPESLYNQLFRNLEKIQANYLKPVALGAPLPIKMVTRIIPDELLRLAAAGEMSLASILASMSSGALNYTTAGKLIITAKEMEKVVTKIEELNDLYKKLDSAVLAGETKLADDYRSLILNTENKVGTRKELKKQLNTFNDRAETLVPGMSRNVAEVAQGLMGKERMDPRVMVYERSRIVENARKQVDADGMAIDIDGIDNTNWVTGTARDIVSMSTTPEYIEVAKAMLAGGSKAVELLPERFLSGDLKEVFDKIYKKFVTAQGSQTMELAPYPLTTIEGASMWVNTIYNDILTRTAKDRVAIAAIATGELGTSGKSISVAPSWTPNTRYAAFNVYEASTEFKEFVKNNILTNPESPMVAPFSRTVATEKDVSELTKFFTGAFALYRNTSQKVTRTPLQQYSKWKRVIELIPAMDPKQAAKMVAALEKTDIDEWVKQSARLELPRAQGSATAKEVEILAEMYGHQRVDDILYNFENRTYAGYKHNLLFAFFDAWKEQWQVWGRTIANNPSNIEKGRLLKEGLTNVELPEVAGLQEGQGILYSDPQTGQQSVAVPFSKPVLNMLGLNGSETLSAKGLSVVGSAVPGLFGFGAVLFDSVIPKTESGAAFRKLLFPIGDPSLKNRIGSYLVPAWGQAIGAGGVGLLDRTVQTDLADNIASFLGTEESEALRASTFNAVLTNIASNSGTVPRTAEEQRALLEEVHTKTDLLLLIKGMFRIFSPTSSMTTYYTEIGEENLAAAAIMDELRKTTDEAPSYYEGVTKFLEENGESVWIFLAGATTAQPGVVPTKEYAAWQTKNNEILENYPFVGGYLGPQEGAYDPNAYKLQKQLEQRTTTDIKIRSDAALNAFAKSKEKEKSREIIQRGLAQGLTEEQTQKSETYKSEMREQVNLLQKNFPSYKSIKEIIGSNERELTEQILEIERMVKDPQALKQPAGIALKEYWDSRARKLDELKVVAPDSLLSNAWRRQNKTEPLRQFLNQKGAYLVYTYPEFQYLWERVLSQEFLPPQEVGE